MILLAFAEPCALFAVEPRILFHSKVRHLCVIRQIDTDAAHNHCVHGEIMAPLPELQFAPHFGTWTLIQGFIVRIATAFRRVWKILFQWVSQTNTQGQPPWWHALMRIDFRESGIFSLVGVSVPLFHTDFTTLDFRRTDQEMAQIQESSRNLNTS